MTTIAAFDPGKVTGLAVGYFSKDVPLEVKRAGAITYAELVSEYDVLRSVGPMEDIWVSEVFEHRDNNFTPDYTGVRVEGILESIRPDIVWRSPSKKAQVPDQVLKDHGFWYTGSDVDWEDGRDVNDAIIHLLGYVAFDLRHRPTLERYFRG